MANFATSIFPAQLPNKALAKHDRDSNSKAKFSDKLLKSTAAQLFFCKIV
jgi:hypothetical protein